MRRLLRAPQLLRQQRQGREMDLQKQPASNWCLLRCWLSAVHGIRLPALHARGFLFFNDSKLGRARYERVLMVASSRFVSLLNKDKVVLVIDCSHNKRRCMSHISSTALITLRSKIHHVSSKAGSTRQATYCTLNHRKLPCFDSIRELQPPRNSCPCHMLFAFNLTMVCTGFFADHVWDKTPRLLLISYHGLSHPSSFVRVQVGTMTEIAERQNSRKLVRMLLYHLPCVLRIYSAVTAVALWFFGAKRHQAAPTHEKGLDSRFSWPAKTTKTRV